MNITNTEFPCRECGGKKFKVERISNERFGYACLTQGHDRCRKPEPIVYDREEIEHVFVGEDDLERFRRLYPNLNEQEKGKDMTTEANSASDIFKSVLTDARESFVHGAGVGAAAEARTFCLDVLNGVLPGDLPAVFRNHPAVRRVEPIAASLLVMFLATFFKAWLPYADRAYWVAKTALEADGRDVIQPALGRIANLFRDRLANIVVPNQGA